MTAKEKATENIETSLAHMPRTLLALHGQEERQHHQALIEIGKNKDLLLHIRTIEAAMDVLYGFRDLDTEDEDQRVLVFLGVRAFSAFSVAIKLILSGYHLFGGQVLRDLMETAFLVDLFYRDPSAIKRWRLARTNKEINEFRPASVRATLNAKDGGGSKKRDELYKMFSELAGHPTLASQCMLKPYKRDTIMTGPFFDFPSLRAGLHEMASLAAQIGETYVEFGRGHDARFEAAFALPANKFMAWKKEWYRRFYPQLGVKL